MIFCVRRVHGFLNGRWPRIAPQSGRITEHNGKIRLVIPLHTPVNATTTGTLAKTAGLVPEQFRELL